MLPAKRRISNVRAMPLLDFVRGVRARPADEPSFYAVAVPRASQPRSLYFERRIWKMVGLLPWRSLVSLDKTFSKYNLVFPRSCHMDLPREAVKVMTTMLPKMENAMIPDIIREAVALPKTISKKREATSSSEVITAPFGTTLN